VTVAIRRLWLYLLVGLIAAWLLLPATVVFPMSLNETSQLSIWPKERSLHLYREFFDDPEWFNALIRSLRTAAIVSVLATALGTAAALGIVRGFRRGAGLINAVILAPIIVPVVVAAVASYLVYLRWGLVGTPLALIVAHTSLAIPYVVVTVMASLRGVNPRLELAARSLGSSPASAVWHVTFPLIRGGMVVGAFLAFMQSFDEVVISVFLASRGSRTLPVQMYSSLIEDIDATVAVASSVILILSIVLVLLVGVTRLASARSDAR